MSDGKMGRAASYGEPWTYRKPLGAAAGVRMKNEQFIGDFYDPFGHRAVECVNACAGMDDPAKEIARLKNDLARLRDELARWKNVGEYTAATLQPIRYGVSGEWVEIHAGRAASARRQIDHLIDRWMHFDD